MQIFNPPSSTSPARSLARAGVIAAMYVILTVITPFTITFGPLQFRISEALMLLPIHTVDAIPGLFIGCLLANLLGGGVWFDVVLGSIATLLAAIFVYKWRDKPLLAVLSPVIFNGLIVGPVVYFAYVRAPGDPISVGTLLFNMATVAFGELVVCGLLGMAMHHGLKKLPESIFN